MPFPDTTVLLDLTSRRNRGKQEAARAAIRRLSSPDSILATSRFNVAELFVGIELCNDPIAERRRIDEALENLVVFEFDEECGLRYAKIIAKLKTLGKPTGVMDVLIASVALGTDQPLLTRNVKHFSNIAGLSVVGY